jgi:hypothetical protein
MLLYDVIIYPIVNHSPSAFPRRANICGLTSMAPNIPLIGVQELHAVINGPPPNHPGWEAAPIQFPCEMLEPSAYASHEPLDTNVRIHELSNNLASMIT